MIEQREHKRVYFAREQEVTAQCERPGDVVLRYDISVTDISCGGLGGAIERDCLGGIEKGSRLVLKRFSGFGPITRLSEMEVEVKWVLDYQPLKHVGLGLLFVNVSNEQLEVLDILTR